ncbi:MAG TPA: ankyrin repeat domain-containing protein [Puia sp.]|nr:ankyrin repeat domain-containing protein [Puia sp.]
MLKENSRTKFLFQAIRSGNAEALNAELGKGASANDSLNGYSALMAATMSGSTEQMRILIDHGAHINDTTKEGVSALWLAVPDFDKTLLLLAHGADVHHTVEGYGILVKLALTPGTEKIFHLLIEKGADPKKSAPDNFLLYNAASAGDVAIISMLIKCGLNVNSTIASGDYPINAALALRSSAAVKILVENGADVNVRFKSSFFTSYNGITPLMFAALNYDKPSFFYLLDHGADPNIKNSKGYTALMLLQQSEIDDPELTQALINHGASVSVKTSDGTDALTLAQKKGNTKSVELLKKYASIKLP